MLVPQEKIKVFISSACGDEPEKYKYNLVRAGLKALIESTNLAKVYVFESEGASTYSAGKHYTYALEDCDVCIFLIDNYDKISNGVQTEIDTANKHHIRSLYYFCDERSKEETPLQKSLKGAKFAKSKVVHSFEDFITRGATDLIEDLVKIYKEYCVGRIDWIDNDIMEEKSNYPLVDSYYEKDDLIEKSVIGSIDKIKDYFSKMILENPIEVKKTNELDKLCSKFLDIMFNNKSIQEFNLSLLLKEIQKEQTPEHYEVTKKRWEAIQEYYLGNLESCISILKDALELAKESKLPDWLIKDILIDLRNQQCFLGEKNNLYKIDNEFQTEIVQSKYLLHYPLIDRFYSDYYEDILKKNMESIIQSPHTILLGNNLYSAIKYLSSIFLLAMVNGSLTHLQLIYDKIKQLSFYCCEKYSNWNFRMLLIKTTIINCNSKEIDRITKYFDDIICKMNSKDAKEIYDFASNRPIEHQRFIAKLEAIGVVGYFMDENDFKAVWEEISNQINIWIEDIDSSVVMGNHIYRALKNIYLRIEQDEIALICYKSLKSKKYRFFEDVFDLISTSININKLSENIRINLLDEIIYIISKEEIQKSIYNIDSTLYIFRKQNRELTEGLDQAIAEYMPEFYGNDYYLEVTEESQDRVSFIEKSLFQIKERNTSQGKNGQYIGYGNRPHIVIKNILDKSDIKLDNNKIDNIFKIACGTLMKETQTIEEKVEAIELLVYLCKTNSSILDRNPDIVLELKENKDIIESGKSVMSNLGEMHLHFSALLLYSSLGEEIWIDMIESLANMGDDLLSQIHASKAILYFLESNDKVLLSSQLESVILQNAFKWCNSSSRDVRWYAIRILFSLLRNPKNHGMICNQLVKHMDSDNVYIKNSILNKIDLIKDIDPETYNYILQKASIDTNYVVREVYKNTHLKIK